MFVHLNPNSLFNYREIGHVTPDSGSELTPSNDLYFELKVIQNGIVIPFLMKKCCKKYKKGKRCKKCPNQ